jgi:hypothetical protein
MTYEVIYFYKKWACWGYTIGLATEMEELRSEVIKMVSCSMFSYKIKILKLTY